ncbi:MAG: hypothetical protein RL885_29680 [Planctomycetota bacterium]
MTEDIDPRLREALRERKRRLLFTSLYITLSVMAAGFIVVMGVLFFAGQPKPGLEWRGSSVEVRLEAAQPHYVGALGDSAEWLVPSTRIEPGTWTALDVSSDQIDWLVASPEPIGEVLRDVVREEIGEAPTRTREILEGTFPIVQPVE